MRFGITVPLLLIRCLAFTGCTQREYASGKLALEGMIKGETDMATAAETPLIARTAL
jgi:hypothetical protein